MEKKIRTLLGEKHEKDLLRKLTPVFPLGFGKIRAGLHEYINLSSNDYLGLSSHPELLKCIKENPCSVTSASASRLMTGSTYLHHELEDKIAEFKGKEAAIVFNSGYQANVGLISALCDKNDCIFADKLVHASMIDGARLSGAKLVRYRHNDIGHLELLLSKERKNCKNALVVTETVFSMDGDIGRIEKIALLKKKFDFVFMVDEAHATGVFGETGAGVAEEKGLSDKIDIIMGTFSKAMAGYGAYVATSKEYKDFFINSCRSFIYSTALPPVIMLVNLTALDLVKKEHYRRKSLLRNASYLREKLSDMGFEVRGESQIVPVITGENAKALAFGERLKKKGYWVLPVRPPTVPEGEARLRISVTFDHNRKVLDNFLEAIAEVRGPR
ncbi:MAG: 8-amino-7-oxononanoate synthase [Candidatus Omnitrophica bacterium]|nr:8-amino-7-oxononanoate synthase [Candidatus Omnitrophota bacterium]